jgi:hypothetical protein
MIPHLHGLGSVNLGRQNMSTHTVCKNTRNWKIPKIQHKPNSNKIKESEGEFEMVKWHSSEKYSQEKGCAICYKL